MFFSYSGSGKETDCSIYHPPVGVERKDLKCNGEKGFSFDFGGNKNDIENVDIFKFFNEDGFAGIDIIKQMIKCGGGFKAFKPMAIAKDTQFGYAIAVNDEKMVVGAPGINTVYVYDLDGSNEVKITAPEGSSEFGKKIKVTSTKIFVSDWLIDKKGAVFVYDLDGTFLNKIVASDGEDEDYFGYDIDVTETKIVVGAALDDDNGSGAGAAYVYDHDGSNETKIVASDGADWDIYGVGVAINDTKVAIGALYDDDNGSNSGSLYVYDHDGSNETKIVTSDGVKNDLVGELLEMSDTVIATRAVNKDDDARGTVYIYDLDGSNEVIISPLDSDKKDNFGSSFAIVGDSIYIGSQLDDDEGDDSGAVYVYGLDGTNGRKITNDKSGSGDEFGWSIAANSDNVFIAAPFSDDKSGEVYRYELGGSNEAEIKENFHLSPIKTIESSLSNKWDYYGSYSRVLGSNNSKIAIGAPLDDDKGEGAGAFYLYDIDGSNEQKIVLSDGTDWEQLGVSLAIDSDKVVVCANQDHDNGDQSGSAFIYNLDGELQKKISPSNEYDLFGTCTVMDENNIFIGSSQATNDNDIRSGVVYIYDANGNNEKKLMASDGTVGNHFGDSIAISDEKIIVGANCASPHEKYSGTFYIYNRDGSNEIKVTQPNPKKNDNFGLQLFLKNKKIYAGLPRQNCVHVFNLEGILETTLVRPKDKKMVTFGTNVVVSDSNIFVSDHGYTDEVGDTIGCVFIYDLDGTNERIIKSPNPRNKGFFGYSMSIQHDKLIIGEVSDKTDEGYFRVQIYDLNSL